MKILSFRQLIIIVLKTFHILEIWNVLRTMMGDVSADERSDFHNRRSTTCGIGQTDIDYLKGRTEK
jgi:hypothetical protein